MKRGTTYTYTVSFRLEEGDHERLLSTCRSLGVSQSQYLRYLIRLPAVPEPGDQEAAVIVDRKSIGLIARELRNWGYHYNQAVHALNVIKYGIEHGSLEPGEAARNSEKALLLLGEVEDGRTAMERRMADLQGACVMGAS